MKFEQVKGLLENLNWSIYYPTLRSNEVSELIAKVLKDIELSMAEQTIEPLSDFQADLARTLSSQTINVSISALSSSDKVTIGAVIELLGNINNLYGKDILAENQIKLIRSLISTRITLDDEIKVLKSLLNRVGKIFLQEAPSISLSQKYYEEFESYMSKISHDERY